MVARVCARNCSDGYKGESQDMRRTNDAYTPKDDTEGDIGQCTKPCQGPEMEVQYSRLGQFDIWIERGEKTKSLILEYGTSR